MGSRRCPSPGKSGIVDSGRNRRRQGSANRTSGNPSSQCLPPVRSQRPNCRLTGNYQSSGELAAAAQGPPMNHTDISFAPYPASNQSPIG